MRYIYELRKKCERNSINLRDYENEINYSLKQFNENEIRGILEEFSIEKDGHVVVRDDSFEFSFPGCLNKKSLQKMGKILAREFCGVNGFIRKKNKAFVFVSYEEEREDEQILLEFVDCSTLDIENENYMYEVPDWVQFYRKLELSVSHISLIKAENIFGKIADKLKGKKELIFEVEIKHRSIAYSVEGNNDNMYRIMRENTCIIEHLYSAGLYKRDMIDFVDISFIDKVPDTVEKNIKNKFDEMYSEIANKHSVLKDDSEIKDRIDNILDNYSMYELKTSNEPPKFLFTVHNVGQALATSLQIVYSAEEAKTEKRIPFFYFDYGIACRQNKVTLPTNINIRADASTIILLSHIHEDHWCGFRENKEAFKATWIIPQVPSKNLSKVLSEIYINNGKFLLLNTIGTDIYFEKNIHNICIKGGNYNTKSKDKHETGIALLIESKCDEAKYRILVSGDQKYSNHIPDFLLDINTLVASHHGGFYGKASLFPAPNNKNNKVIYSYGKGNTYNHPSKVKDYRNKFWNNEYHTTNGNYEIIIG